ncbi:putative nuclease HARBI1-like protein, partial [Leptotrombidium deliense]
IDGTHILVVVPKAVQERFRNRKNCVSVNCQVIIDDKMRIRNLIDRWPGSVHDSRIFRNSRIYDLLESNAYSGHLLGDAGYPCKRYLLTPHSNPTTASEKKYQKAHIRTRNLIERMFGAWKTKFFCLRTQLRLKLETILNVIVACGVILNFCINEKEEIQLQPADINENMSGSDGDIQGMQKRRNLINSYFI